MPVTFSSEQKAAIEHEGGPLLIIAGAGTGKTLVITHRIAHLIATKRAKPHEILALTFTEKAASEMEERVDGLTPYGYTDVSILTFHAFGDRLLREYGLRIGLPPDFQVLSWPEQVVFFRKHLFNFPLVSYRPLGNPTRYIESLLTHMSRLKDEAIAPVDYQASADRLVAHAALHPENPALMQEATLQKELADTYALYRRITLENHCIDYGDQVSLAIDLLRFVPAGKLPYRYILVDEFQDTNPAQFQLLRALAQQGACLTVVGDDDQSIYRFRGAAISNIQQFTTIYPDTAKVVLTQNFRSCQKILDAAYQLIQYNNPNRLEVIEKIDKRLYAMGEQANTTPLRGSELQHPLGAVIPTDPTATNGSGLSVAPVGAGVAVATFDTRSAEADWIAKVILEGISKGQRYQAFAILVRRNADAEAYLRTLNLFNIPNRFTGNQGLFNRPEVRLMIAFMRAVCDRNNSTALYFLLTSDLYRFPIGLLSERMIFAKRNNRSLYAVLEAPTDLKAPADSEPLSLFHKLKDDLDAALKRSLEVNAGVVLYEFIKKSGLLSTADDAVICNIARFFDEIKRICPLMPTPRIQEVVETLDLLLAAGDDPAMAEADFEEDAVSVLTVHRAKGLEFDTVFMVGLHDGGFPTREKNRALTIPPDLLPEETENLHSEEERRLFYVGMTRAKHKLVLTHAHSTGAEGQGRPRKISPFVVEALDLPRAAVRAVKSSPRVAIEQAVGVVAATLDQQRPLGAVGVTSQTLSSLRRPTEAMALECITPPVGGGRSLTYYQIDDYLTCPMKYKYIHILGVPIYPHHTIVYGNSVHQAIAAYLRAKQEEIPFTAEAMLRVFENGWKSEGYLSRTHEDQRMEKGRQALLRFYEAEEKRNIRPTYIEKEFSFLFEGIKIKGRWDRIDHESHHALVIDYKTSDVTRQQDADKKARESMQLTLYAWAYQERTSFLPQNVLLHFVESGLIGTSVREHDDIEKCKEKVRAVTEGTRKQDFEARPTYMACRYCAYQDICPATVSA